jgi:cell division septal protein FtsQ
LKPFLAPLILSTVFTTLLLLSTLALTSSPPPANDVALQLERRTQELLDAIAAGNRDPWARYLHDDLVYAAEDGSIKSKAQLLEELQPLPKQIWGSSVSHISGWCAAERRLSAVT